LNYGGRDIVGCELIGKTYDGGYRLYINGELLAYENAVFVVGVNGSGLQV